jgi:branched-chain amino acid transport system substrate-binding protein
MIGKLLGAAVVATTLAVSSAAFAADDANLIKIGVLTDESSLWADYSGSGSVLAAKMALEDFGEKNLDGKKVEFIHADHQNSPDVGISIARKWFDTENVDVIVDLPSSPTATAVAGLAAEKGKLALVSAGGTTDLTGKYCSPNTVQWVYNTYAVANAGSLAATDPGDTWYFITVDYTFGHQLQQYATDAIEAAGGKVIGSTLHPLNNPDFATPFLQARASGAKVVGLALGAGDTANALKQAAEFRITQGGQKLVAMNVWIHDINSVGLEAAQGLNFATGFYWDKDDETRAFSKRFFEVQKKMPTMSQAGVYSSVLHYLKAVKAAGTKDTNAVIRKMHELPVNDMFAHNAHIRADGQLIHDMQFVKVKSPSESKYPWDYYQIEKTIPGEKAYAPISPDCKNLFK